MDVGLVCDACSALTPIGVPQCARCGEPVALDPRPRRGSHPPNQGTVPDAATICGKCNGSVPPNFRFCPNCGNRIPPPISFEVDTRVGPRQPSPATEHKARPTMMFGGPVTSARARLTLIRGDGGDGVSFTLAGTDHLAGRGECPISFPDDPFLSPTHANFRYFNGQLTVRDEGSLNGVYVRITGAVKIEAGTTILVGEQVLSISPARVVEDVPDTEGTYFSASMVRQAVLEIVQQLRGGQSGWVYRLSGEKVSLGREGNDINFPEDPFISGRHASIQLSSGVLTVSDLGSRNGTFVRATGERQLKHGDYVFLGQQLLRVEIV
jgi:pSer/pThr/pTyr-binding forkhead associated (FHA) protein